MKYHPLKYRLCMQHSFDRTIIKKSRFEREVSEKVMEALEQWKMGKNIPEISAEIIFE